VPERVHRQYRVVLRRRRQRAAGARASPGLQHAVGGGFPMTREEHLAWAKERALEYVVQGDTTMAIASMTSDLLKHDELRRELDPLDLAAGAEAALSDDPELVRRWIAAFE
jgi:hypothetical protein